MSQPDSAVTAYERAWQYGGRGVVLADRLIDLLTRQGRYSDARKYVDQVRDYLTVSQGLFDRAIPYFANSDESQDMVRTAELWAKQNPKNPEARLRLGRVLLMRANASPVDQKQKDVDLATQEFRRAIELAPNDVRSWSSIVILYGESPATRGEAQSFLEELSKQANISELDRTFVLAQLYEKLSMPSQAQSYYNQAAAIVEADPKAVDRNRVLGRIALFYLPRVPALAETFARRVITQDPANADAKLVLLNVLINRADAESADEGLRLLDDRALQTLVDPVNSKRYRAGFLVRRGRPEDVNAAIELLRGSLSHNREDRLLLAQMYEKAGQLPPALELLQELVRSPNPNAGDLAAFLRFWQQHFVATAEGKTPVQFAGQARDVYKRLGDVPGQLPERLRWQLREMKARKSSTTTANSCMQAVNEVLASSAAKNLNEQETKRLLQLVLIVLLQEQHEECAVQFALEQRTNASPDELAVWLCHAYVAAPAGEESAPVRNKALDKLAATFDKSAEVQQAIADCSFMAGDYERAANAYPRAIQLKPDELMSRNNLALTFVELQKFNEAREILDQALKVKPADPDLLDTLAMIDLIDGHPDQAIPVLKKLVASSPDSPVLRFHLALAYNDAQDSNRSRDELFTAIALGVEQRLLSPRDKKSLTDLKARHLSPQAVGPEQSAPNASQTKN